jgi:hypothetical protein
MNRPFFAACAALALAACATPTVYAPANPNATGTAQVGFSEYRIENNRYRVTFQGGGGAPERLVADYALLRAAEITLRDGYDWFQVVDRFGGVAGSPNSGPRVSIGGGTSSGYGRYGGSGFGVGVGTSMNLGGGAAYAHTLEILLGRGARPATPDVYDARGVAAALAPNAPRY